MRNRTESDHLAAAAVISAGAMIAFQVAGKATRDALFLSNFPVTALPGMLVLGGAVSVAAVLGVSYFVSKKGPGAVIPLCFGASSGLLFAEWLLLGISPRAASVVLYLHVAIFGAILISGFWAIVAELFDPRTAKANIGRIAAGGTLGGLLGGIAAERVGALFSVNAMLPVLGSLHLTCALLNRRLHRQDVPGVDLTKAMSESRPRRSAFQVLREVSYLRHLAMLVLAATIAETMLDYLLKAGASGAYSQTAALMRFFAIFYTAVSLLTFLVQAALSKYFLQEFGLTGSVSSMPFSVVAGGILTLIWPGLVPITLGRGVQSILRSSLFRSGYELLYTPVAREEKRATKIFVDVGFDRLGDAIGGGLIQMILLAGLAASTSNRMLSVIAVSLGAVALILTSRISRGYVSTLEKSLLNQAAELELLDTDEKMTRATMFRTLGTVDLRTLRAAASGSPAQIAKPSLAPSPATPEAESAARRIIELNSDSADVVRAALRSRRLSSGEIAAAIRLLARDDLSEDAVKALRTTAALTVGQLTDALLNPDEDFAVRRRIPRVLASCITQRAVDGLMLGLEDARFEVRFSCGRGLERICRADKTLSPHSEAVYSVTRKEIAAAQRLAEAPRVLDQYDDIEGAPSTDASWASTDIRLEHIFRLFSLCLPREPLHAAFRAMHTENAFLRGTALEYLESVLPSDIRLDLWRFFEHHSAATAVSRSTDPRRTT